MGSGYLLLYVSISIILFNVLTVKFRERRARRLEEKILQFAKNHDLKISLDEISSLLEIPLYDAKILVQRFEGQGKIEIDEKDGKKLITFKG